MGWICSNVLEFVAMYGGLLCLLQDSPIIGPGNTGSFMFRIKLGALSLHYSAEWG
jgi:hypothetical protein